MHSVVSHITRLVEKQVDIRNVCLYGGFEQQLDEEEDLPVRTVSR